jgi:hypothetical protein
MSLQICKFLSWNLCGLEEGINSLLMLPVFNKITKVLFVYHPLLSYLCQNNSKLSKTITIWCEISIAFQQYANQNDWIVSNFTMCKNGQLSWINFRNSTTLQTIITLPIHLKIEQNNHQRKHNFNSFPTSCKSRMLDNFHQHKDELPRPHVLVLLKGVFGLST